MSDYNTSVSFEFDHSAYEHQLANFLQQRPDATELLQRNIIKGARISYSHLSPSRSLPTAFVCSRTFETTQKKASKNRCAHLPHSYIKNYNLGPRWNHWLKRTLSKVSRPKSNPNYCIKESIPTTICLL